MTRPGIAYVRLGVAAAVVLLLACGATVAWRSARALRSAAGEVRGENEFRFTVHPLAPRATGFETISSPAVFLQAAQFQDHLYVASAAGLLEYDPAGALVRQYAVGRELPGSPLTAIAAAVLADSRVPELVIATGSDGILAFNGQSFRQILPASPDARAINAILPTPSGHLLLG